MNLYKNTEGLTKCYKILHRESKWPKNKKHHHQDLQKTSKNTLRQKTSAAQTQKETLAKQKL